MVFYKNIIYSSLLTFLNFIFLINSEKDEELIEDCGYQINPFGGRISLDGQEFINGHKINCIWIINKQNSYKNFSLTKSSYFDNIFLHIDQFHLKGENITLEIREGINSEGKILIKLEGEQSSKQLAQKQLEQGFEIKIENENGFYIRLQGKIENNSGLSIPYSYFYRWPDPPCNSSMDEFYCDNNKCISNILRCNGYDHCGDSSDEMCNFKGETTNIEYDPLWKSAIVTVIFALLALLLLTLLMILIVSRSARNHLIHSLPSNSIQSIQYRQQQQPRRRGRTTETAIALNNNNNTLDCQGRGILPNNIHHNHHNCSNFNHLINNYQLNNNNQQPTIQTLGDRRFYLFPSDTRSPISLIEAPPTYQDALKHPKVI